MSGPSKLSRLMEGVRLKGVRPFRSGERIQAGIKGNVGSPTKRKKVKF